MKKLILSAALILLSAYGALFAQDNAEESYTARLMGMTKAAQTFNVNENLINIRDFVVLREGRMMLELTDITDYESFRNMDSILREFKKDIAFYKDSLAANPVGNVRIDYSYSPGFSFKKLRFKRYNPDGSMFLNQGGDISRLKFDQDTICIILQKEKPGIGGRCMIPYTVQAVFYLDNYYDVDRLLADNMLNKVVDTLEKVSRTKESHVNKKRLFSQYSITYNPYYAGEGSLQMVEWLMKNEYSLPARKRTNEFISINATLGLGLVRNTLAPTGDIGIQYSKYWGSRSMHNLTRLSASPYFLFDKDEKNNYVVRDNWFINAEIGSIYDKKNKAKLTDREVTFGVGYLVLQKGDYFKNTTFKIFTNLMLTDGLTLMPEIIVTDNFKQIFPGLTLKIF